MALAGGYVSDAKGAKTGFDLCERSFGFEDVAAGRGLFWGRGGGGWSLGWICGMGYVFDGGGVLFIGGDW